MHSLECYFGVYFPRCCATREINTKITLSWAHKQFATRVHALFYIYLDQYLLSLLMHMCHLASLSYSVIPLYNKPPPSWDYLCRYFHIQILLISTYLNSNSSSIKLLFKCMAYISFNEDHIILADSMRDFIKDVMSVVAHHDWLVEDLHVLWGSLAWISNYIPWKNIGFHSLPFSLFYHNTTAVNSLKPRDA